MTYLPNLVLCRGADTNFNHFLVKLNMEITKAATKKRTCENGKEYNMSKLQKMKMKEKYA